MEAWLRGLGAARRPAPLERVSEEEREWEDRRTALLGATIRALTLIPSQTGTSEGQQQS